MKIRNCKVNSAAVTDLIVIQKNANDEEDCTYFDRVNSD